MDTDCQNISAFYDALGDACNNPRAAECASALTQALVQYGKPCLDLSYVRDDPTMPPFRPYVCAEATGPLAALCDLDPSGAPTGAAVGGIDWDAPVTVTTGQAAGVAVGGAAAIAAAAAAAGRRSARRPESSAIQLNAESTASNVVDAARCQLTPIYCLEPDDPALVPKPDPPPLPASPTQEQIEARIDLVAKIETENAARADLRNRIRDIQRNKPGLIKSLERFQEHHYPRQPGQPTPDIDKAILGDLTGTQQELLDQVKERVRIYSKRVIQSASYQDSMYCAAMPLLCTSAKDMELKQNVRNNKYEKFEQDRAIGAQLVKDNDIEAAYRHHDAMVQEFVAGSSTDDKRQQRQALMEHVRQLHEASIRDILPHA